MAFILSQVLPVNGAKNFPIESTIQITFSKNLDPATVNSGTITLTDRDTNQVVSSVFQVTGKTAILRPALTLRETTAYKIDVVGSDLQQPLAGFISAEDGDPLLFSQTIHFETGKKIESEVVNQTISKSNIETFYIYDDSEGGLVPTETLKLKLLGSTPESGEMFISPYFLAENGIRLHFNRPVDLESAKLYIDLSHAPLAGIRAMAFNPESVKCSFADQAVENFCIDGRNEKLHPKMNYYIQGNDVLLTYADTVADVDALNWVDPGTSSTSDLVIPPFDNVIPDPVAEPDYNFTIVGELTEESHRFNFGAHTSMWLTFETHIIKDRYKVEINGINVYDSGCIATDGAPLTVEVPITPYTAFHVIVLGGCDIIQNTKATAWSFTVTSYDPNAISSSSSASSSSSSSSSATSSSSSESSSSSLSSSSLSSSSSSSLSSSSSSSSTDPYEGCVFIGPVLNAEVRINIKSALKSAIDTNNLSTTLGEDKKLFFLMGMFPLYSDVDLVRLDLDNLNNRYADEQIFRVILKTSLEAWRLSCSSFDLCSPPDEAILYVENKSVLDFFDLTFASGAVDRGKALHLGDWSARTGARASNSKRTPKEDELRSMIDAAIAALRAFCPSPLGILHAIKGRRACTTKPNFRTRTYKYLSNGDMWIAPPIKGASRYFELPHFGEKYS